MKITRLILLFLLLLVACIPVTGGPTPATATNPPLSPSVTPPATSPTVDAALAKLTGSYQCMGHENGLIAGFGAFSITAEGKLSDGQKDWALAPTATALTYTVVDHPQFAQLVIQKDGTFNIVMKPGLKVAHADDGYVWCQKSQ